MLTMTVIMSVMMVLGAAASYAGQCPSGYDREKGDCVKEAGESGNWFVIDKPEPNPNCTITNPGGKTRDC